MMIRPQVSRPIPMNKSLALLSAFAFLAGCQNLANTGAGHSQPAAGTSAATPPAPAQPVVYGSFSEDSIYNLLVGELAGQRNRFDIALDAYASQAVKTQDPAIAERALRIAEYSGADQIALQTALIWAKNAPSDLEAQRAAAIQLARNGRYDESMAYMEKVLQGQGDTHFDFLALSAAESDPNTRAGLLKSFDRLLEKYPDNGQLLFGKALLLQQDGKPEAALALLGNHKAKGDEVAPLLLRARLLQGLKRGDEALPLLQSAIKKYPDDKRIRLTYARMLVEQNRMTDAKAEFTTLVQQYPEDDDLRFSLALVCIEAQAWNEATGYLNDLIARGSHTDAAHANLGRIAELRKDPQTALTQYAQVGPGSDYLAAIVRQNEILVGSGRAAEAYARLAKAREMQPDYVVQLYLLEVESLESTGHADQAWQLLDQALKKLPNSTDLLYTRSMLAEKRNDLKQTEADLRTIIQHEPNNAIALNALGYTLADRTNRYAEAKVLIEQALHFSPQDPAYLDSLGWVNYRLGNLPEAERLLRLALARLPDPEVAAHLGEILWASGKRSEAKQVWQNASKTPSESPALRDTIKRLTGSETP